MNRKLNIELREAASGESFEGVILQEGRAASGGRAEVFAPGSLRWPSAGVGLLDGHAGTRLATVHPHRQNDGRISVSTRATKEIRRAVDAGRRFMSIEFYSLEERTTRGGVREVIRAFVDAAALVSSPEYDMTRAEVRGAKRKAIL